MVILHVTVQVKPEHVPEYLKAVRHDAEHSERDEPGCLRFDVIQDREDANRFYYYEAELRCLTCLNLLTPADRAKAAPFASS